MGAFIDRTGQVYGGLQIIKEAGGGLAICKCLNCGYTDKYVKSEVVRMKVACKNHCNKANDKTGQTFNGIKVVTELGGSKIIGECIHCGNNTEYKKGDIVYNQRKNCGCKAGTNFKDKTGQTFKGIKIIEELGDNKVIGECLHCKSKNTYDKGSVVGNNYRSCGCVVNLKDKTGQTLGDLKIITDNGSNIVTAVCIKCRHEDIYNKHYVIKGQTFCKKCHVRAVSKVGSVYGTIEILKELGGGRIEAKCLKCEATNNYSKYDIMKNRIFCLNCKYGSLKSRKLLTDTAIKNIVIIKFEYTGRDSQCYYSCTCAKCKEELILSYDEIFEYTCKN